MKKEEKNGKKPGIKEVAVVAGVSPTTVSRVLNNRGYISEETRTKVYGAMDEIGYYPNEIARALLNHRTYFIGVIVPSITAPFHGEIVKNVEYYLSKQGYKMLLCNSNNQIDTEKEYINMLKRNQVDGMIVGTHNDIVDAYREIELPVVAIDRDLGEKVVTVSCDNHQVGQLATTYLLEQGCRNILCIRGNSKLKMPGNARSQAYKDIMKDKGYPALVLEVPFINPTEEKRRKIREMMEQHPEIDGIFAGDDSLAVIALKIAKEKGIKVPEELKIIGVDGAGQTLEYVPELTTIRQPIEEIAKVAVEKLICLIEGNSSESSIQLPVKLIKGKTA